MVLLTKQCGHVYSCYLRTNFFVFFFSFFYVCLFVCLFICFFLVEKFYVYFLEVNNSSEYKMKIKKATITTIMFESQHSSCQRVIPI